MLRKRVIPIVLFDGYSVIKTINFKTRRNLGSAITVARTYNTRNVDELILLDIDATEQNRSIDIFGIKDIATELHMPLTVGGGIRTIDDVRLALKMGADKVAINTEAIKNPQIIKDTSDIFGRQCIVASVDVIFRDNKYHIYNNKKTIEGLELIPWCQKLEKLGAGEILINNISRDGLMEGADIELADQVSKAVTIPVIYAGGVSTASNCAHTAQTGISGIGISSIFHFTSITPLECKQKMKEAGIPVRL